ncbi:flagellar basal body L-ring protein FlgH [Roseivivax sp. CAU 1753]
MRCRVAVSLLFFATLISCESVKHVGRPPEFTNPGAGDEHRAMMYSMVQEQYRSGPQPDAASLWNNGRHSLLGDRRAEGKGDILTVVIEIDEKAEISNSTSRARSGSESLGIPQLFGLPQQIAEDLPLGATIDPAISIDSSSASGGDGSVRRNEKLTLRVAATVLQVLPNGILQISGSQEVRVNFEIRELLVTGYVRPADISRLNEITYDKIASARISYGGRGQITDVQQPRYGQQILDIVTPF